MRVYLLLQRLMLLVQPEPSSLLLVLVQVIMLN